VCILNYFSDESSLDRYRCLLQEISPIVWEADAAGEVLGEIPGWVAFTGQPHARMQQWGWLDVIHPDDRPRIGRAWQSAVDRAVWAVGDRQVRYRVEYRLRHISGDYRWMAVYGMPIFNPDGTVDRWIGYHLDITDRKTAESDLQVRQIEIDRLEAQLQQTSQLAQQRDLELDRFTYTISHDLKAPLRAVKNLSEWIEEDLSESVPIESRRQLELLRTRVRNMEASIDGLLQYSRISRMEVSVERVDVVESIAKILNLLSPPANFAIVIVKNLTFQTKRWFLEQVFYQLIDNAIKHHDRADGNIQISGQTLADGYEFTVTDDGPGIPPDRYEFVFGIFNTLGDRQDNIGIGLPIVKKIVESQGGGIELAAAVGRGTSCRFTWSKSPEPQDYN
jgi:PAS domain S-box-containing protein